jgi:DNA invertase Pin-like site-specific DNA recombinase
MSNKPKYFSTIDQRGFRGLNAKLTEEQAIEIHRLMDTKIRRKLIARKFNVSTRTLNEIKSGKNWTYLKQRLDSISPNLS